MCVLFLVEDVRFSKQPIIWYFCFKKNLVVVDFAYEHDKAHENVYHTRYICAYCWSGLCFLPSLSVVENECHEDVTREKCLASNAVKYEHDPK